MPETSIKRCAIYTPKSSEEGLEQDYNSLHAQRDACEAFIKSRAERADALSKPPTTIAVSPAAPWKGRRCSNYLPASVGNSSM